MGYEYKIYASVFNQEAALQFIQQRFVVAETATSLLQVAVHIKKEAVERTDLNTEWPSVFLFIESDGLYFCDNRTSIYESAVIFKQLVDYLMGTNQDIRYSLAS